MKKKMMLILVLALLLAVSVPASASPLSDTTVWSVVEDESVTLRLENFPDDEVFNVYMGFNGTQGINGYLVSRLATNDGGTFYAKFLIPEGLEGEDIIAIRFESQDSNTVWYNWFYNETAAANPVTVPAGDQPTYNNLVPGFPTFTITEVKKGQHVKLVTKYFPANDRWAVMVDDGAKEIYDNWVEMAGIESAEGGSLNITFSIPGHLQYVEKIAIMFLRIKDDFRTYDLILNQDYP